MEINERIEHEKMRLTSLLDGTNISDKRREALEAVIDNLAFMRIKLECTVSEISEEGLSVPYDNGGGQAGIRENPAYRAYINMWKSYLSGIEKVIAALPAESKAIVEDDVQSEDNVLQIVMNRKRGIS